MGLRRRKKQQPEEPILDEGGDRGDDRRGYSPAMEERMRRLESYSYDFDETEAAEVEARLRRMFYGAKVEDE